MRNVLKLFVVLLSAVVIQSAGAAPAEQPAAPQFSVKGTSGKTYSLAELNGKTVVLEWFNSGCPFVQRAYKSGAMQRLQSEYTKKGFIWLTVNSTHSGHQDFLDAGKSKETLAKWSSSPTDYVIDSDGSLGKLFGAKTTPQLFVIGPNGHYLYRGALDNYPDAEDDADKLVPYFENALKEAADNKTVSVPLTQEYGCSIKYAS